MPTLNYDLKQITGLVEDIDGQRREVSVIIPEGSHEVIEDWRMKLELQSMCKRDGLTLLEVKSITYLPKRDA